MFKDLEENFLACVHTIHADSHSSHGPKLRRLFNYLSPRTNPSSVLSFALMRLKTYKLCLK